MRKVQCRCVFVVATALAAVLMLPLGTIQAASVTVATFADPTGNSNNPLFTVDWGTSLVTGGWADGKGGLVLNVPLTNASFTNAWFAMDQLTITSQQVLFGSRYGETGAGQIRFYAAASTTIPLIQIDFQKGTIGKQFLAADELFYANTVMITGSAIPTALSYEQFSFSFANVIDFPAGNGFTSTASFTSSAVPEPLTLSLLGLGAVALRRRKA